MKIFKLSFLSILICFVIIILGLTLKDDKNRLRKINTNDDYNYIAINEIFMWVSNNGDGSHDPRTDGCGLYWPGGKSATLTAVFEDGLVWGGIVDGQIRVNGDTHRQGLQAGKILGNGVADDPSKEKYRIYKIRIGWEELPPGQIRDEYEKDYNEWPVEDGAPWVDIDGDGKFTRGIDKPEFIGDEVLWFVSNDMDPIRSIHTFGSNPIGLEIQTTVYGFFARGDIGDIVFKKYKIINKGRDDIDSMFLGYWTDDDLGDANDDFVGCDTSLNLGYTYNGDENDGGFYDPPAAVGHLLLQGPVIPASFSDTAFYNGKQFAGYKNLPLTSFVFFIGASAIYKDPSQGHYIGTIEVYNYLNGLLWEGSSFIDPTTGESTVFLLPGDPVTGSGWYEGDGWPMGAAPSDRRLLISSGPFHLATSDTQEVVYAIIMAQGTDRLNSITQLRRKSSFVQEAYNNNWLKNLIQNPVTKPVVHKSEYDQRAYVWWEANAEQYNALSLFLDSTYADDTTFSFEGYRFWQFSDSLGSDPYLLQITDLKNNIDEIKGFELIHGLYQQVVFFASPNEGVQRYFNIEKDYINDSQLINGREYYFGVTAYAYNEFSSPQYLESLPSTIKIVPTRSPIDQTISFDPSELITARQTQGYGTGEVLAKIVDPLSIMGDDYEIRIRGDYSNPYYEIMNITKNIILVDSSDFFEFDTTNGLISGGLMFSVLNSGLDSLSSHVGAYHPYRVRELLEISDTTNPTNVFYNYNSTGKWFISTTGLPTDLGGPDSLEYIDLYNSIGFDSFEIRFTSEGSEYYLIQTNRGQPSAKFSSHKASDRVPFEIWRVKSSNDSKKSPEQLFIKIYDVETPDQIFSKNTATGKWDAIYAYSDSTDGGYIEPISLLSGYISSPDWRLNNIIINGELPAEGTVIRINTWKPLSDGDVFVISSTAVNTNDKDAAKARIDQITVYPNPFFDNTFLYRDQERKVTFTNLPNEVILRIYSLGGQFVREIRKNDDSPWLDWDLRNYDNRKAAPGIYIAHLEMPGIGEKILKVAIVY